MAQVVSYQHLTTDAWVYTQVKLCGICGGQNGTRKGFLQVLWFSPVSDIPPWLSTLMYHLGGGGGN
jgi:hypothetical protein